MRKHRLVVGLTAIAAALLAGLYFSAREWLLHSKHDGLDRSWLSPEQAAQAHLASFFHADLVQLGFTHARSLHLRSGDSSPWLKVYTRSGEGKLSIHAHGVMFATAAELLAVLREVDLLPQWNRYCDTASVLKSTSQKELWAVAGVRLPWPVPPQTLRVHAKLGVDRKRRRAIVAAARSVSSR